MDKIFGLPAHPFLVHIPVVLLPLSAIGVVLMAVRPAWHRRYRWVVLAVGVVGALGATLAASAGEELESRIIAVEGPQAAASWQRHADLGDTARTVALVYVVILAIFVALPWWLERRAAATPPSTSQGEVRTRSAGPTWAVIAVSIVAVVAAVGCVTTVGLAGHSGSKSVWEDYVAKTGDG